MIHRIFVFENTVINFDNDIDVVIFLKDNTNAKELTSTEIKNIFGEYAHYAGPDNTNVVDGKIIFDKTKLPPSVTDLGAWLKNVIRPARNKLLKETDWLYRSDIEALLTTTEKTMRDDYCKLLRDFTSTFTEITNDEIDWPEKPQFKTISF